MLRACNSHFLEVQDSFIMSRVWSCEPTRIGLGILHAAFFAWICESSIFRLSTKLQCGSLSFLAISTKIWWVQFRVVKCILLAVNLSPRGVTTWSCAWARRVLRIFPSRSDWIDIASLTLRRAVEIISYGLMVQVEFLNSFFDRLSIHVSLSTKTYFVHVPCWRGTKQHRHLMNLQGFTLDELKEAKYLGLSPKT